MNTKKGKTGFVLFFALCFAALGDTNLPTLVMLPAYSLTTTTAGLGASVTTTGASLPAVTIYYGTNSAGTNAANWAYSQALGATNGTAAFTASNLPTYAVHYARASASNSAGIGWSANTIFFYTLKGTPNKTVMVDTNAEVAYPTNFWPANFRFIETPVQDEAETTVDTIVPDYLADFYTQPASDIRYLGVSMDISASEVSVDNLGYSNLVGYTAQGIFDYLDSHFFRVTNSGAGTNVPITIHYYSAGAVTAAHVVVEFNPGNYTPSDTNVEAHLIAIDSRIGYLIAYCDSLSAAITNIATNTPPASNTLASVAITGNASVDERTTENYTLTATYTDSLTEDVSTSTGAVWSLIGSIPTNTSMTNRTLIADAVDSNTQVTMKGLYTKDGTSKMATKLVTIISTDTPPVLTNLFVTGVTNLAYEYSITTNHVYGQWSDGTTTLMDYSSISWGLVSAPTGTHFELTDSCPGWHWGEVYSNTLVTFSVTYPFGSWIVRYITLTLANTDWDTKVKIYGPDGGYGADGVLTLYAYVNSAISATPAYKQSWAYIRGITNIYSVQLPATTTSSYWIALIDAGGDGIANGPMASPVDNEYWRGNCPPLGRERETLVTLPNADNVGMAGPISISTDINTEVDLPVKNRAVFGWASGDIPSQDYRLCFYLDGKPCWPWPSYVLIEITNLEAPESRNFVCPLDYDISYCTTPTLEYGIGNENGVISIENFGSYNTRYTLKCGYRNILY